MKALGPIEACACVDCHYLKDVQKNLLNLLRSAMPTTATRGKYRNITNLKPDLFKSISPCINLCHSFLGGLCSLFLPASQLVALRPLHTISEAFVLGDDHGGLLLLQRDDLSAPRRCWGEGHVYMGVS